MGTGQSISQTTWWDSAKLGSVGPADGARPIDQSDHLFGTQPNGIQLDQLMELIQSNSSDQLMGLGQSIHMKHLFCH